MYTYIIIHKIFITYTIIINQVLFATVGHDGHPHLSGEELSLAVTSVSYVLKLPS